LSSKPPVMYCGVQPQLRLDSLAGIIPTSASDLSPIQVLFTMSLESCSFCWLAFKHNYP
jgi:hypothetical protein